MADTPPDSTIDICLSRIAGRDADIRAWAFHDPLQVRTQLDKVPSGVPLAGVPVGLKDVIDTAGMPTENGTILDKGRVPERDALLVQRLKAAGAVIMGKTVSTELAYFYPGKTRNPHDLARTPGGSSSGSAAAVAAGMVPLAVGTQTTGSVIRPAAFCGVVGFKPTLGLIPTVGVLLQSQTLDTLGVFAKSVSDAAMLAACLADTPLNAEPRATPPRIAFVKSPVWEMAEPSTRAAFEDLAGKLGSSCQTLDLPAAFDQAPAIHRTINMVELSRNFAPYERRGRAQLSEKMCEAIDEGRSTPENAYQAALGQREVLIGLLDPVFAEYDVLLTPATLGEAPRGLETTGDPAFCALWTLCGVPAISLPLLTGPAGMPLGVQLVGRRGGDNQLLSAAQWLIENMPA